MLRWSKLSKFTTKSRAEQNKHVYFLCRDEVNYRNLRKICRTIPISCHLFCNFAAV